MTSGDADTELKFRMHRLLWEQGYFARREVKLSLFLPDRPETPKREDITDIDVLGLKHDENLRPDYVICDCKTDKNATSINRTFWTKGVMDLFGANKGYVVTYKSTKVSKEIAPNFHITAFNNESLHNFETTLGIQDDKWEGSYNISLEETIEKYKNEIKEKYYREYFYYNYRFWLDKPNEQVKRLVSLGRKFNQTNAFSDAEKWFLHEIAIFFSISILSFSNKFIGINENNLIDSVITEWHGGAIDKASRETLIKSVHEFINEYVETECGKKFKLTLKQLNTQPEYVSTSLVDTVLRLLRDPSSSRNIYRFLDICTYYYVVPKQLINKTELVEKFGVSLDFIKSAKLAKDVLRLFCNATQINPDVFKEVIAFG